jgi:hypothetical protein
LSEPAPNQWPHGTSVMVRKRKSWREATIVSRLNPNHWRAEYPGGGSGMFQKADIRALRSGARCDARQAAPVCHSDGTAKLVAVEICHRSRDDYRRAATPKGAGRDLGGEPALPEAL